VLNPSENLNRMMDTLQSIADCSKSSQRRKIPRTMVDIANVPVNDRFRVINRHAAGEIVYPKEGYLGLNCTPDLILIQITWLTGRSTEVKKKFFHQIANEIHEKGAARKEDVWINLVETGR
jgi:4-oxalocrotonate tautomerase